MIKPLVTLFAFGLLMLTPSMASAQKVRRISQMIVGDEVLIEIASTSPMEAPEIATAAGRVTLVLRAGLREMRPMSHDGDPQFVRLVQLRPRSSSSSTAYVLFNNETVVPSAENVRVDVLESGIVLHIPKSAFVAAPAPATAPAAPAAVTVAATAPAAPAVAAPAAAPAPAAVAVAATPAPAARTTPAAAAPAARTAQATPRTTAAQATPPAARSAAPARATAFAAAIPASAGPSAPVIIFLTLLLAGTYFALRQLLAKRQKSVAPAIDVVASKRIGARHQLIVVRAFGRDHLLSVQGSQTTRIASMKSAAAAQALLDQAALKSESPEERSKRIDGLRDDDGLSLADLKIGRVTEEPVRIPRAYPTSLRPAANDSIPAGPKSELRKKLHLDEETRFGAELLRMVKDSMPVRPSVAPIKAESSVAGIARLKKQAIR